MSRQTDTDPSAVLAALTAAIHAHPDQRVAQVIVNALGSDPFYCPNDEAVRQLLAYARKEYTNS